MKKIKLFGLLLASVFCFAVTSCGGGGGGGSSEGETESTAEEGGPAEMPSYAKAALDGMRITYFAPSEATFEMEYPELGNGTKDGQIITKCVLEFRRGMCSYKEQVTPEESMYESPSAAYVYSKISGNIGMLEVTIVRPVRVDHGHVEATETCHMSYRLSFDSENMCEVSYGTVTVDGEVWQFE